MNSLGDKQLAFKPVPNEGYLSEHFERIYTSEKVDQLANTTQRGSKVHRPASGIKTNFFFFSLDNVKSYPDRKKNLVI